jgi:hypothetical protein
MKLPGWFQGDPKRKICEWCGELRECDLWSAPDREQETGYLDQFWICRSCSQSAEGDDVWPRKLTSLLKLKLKR